VLLLAGWWDFAKVQGALAFERIYLLPFAYPATLLAMGYLLLRWLSQAVTAQQKLSMSLEQQLAEREEALRQANAREREAEHRRIRDEERVALLSHVHDGLGSQLVSARMALQHGSLSVARAAEVLAECSDDLRLVLSTLNRPQASLAESVADFRHRLQARLAEAPVKVNWTVALQGLPALRARDVLQVLRVLQEAVTNALRHAQARQINIELTWSEARGLLLAVEDDGRGLPTGDSPTPSDDAPAWAAVGWGMDSQRQRAAALGAQLDCGPGSVGTRLVLRWMPPAAAPEPPAAPGA
jgi:signal transduction histidine kinase